jgi:hypothetical protein
MFFLYLATFVPSLCNPTFLEASVRLDTHTVEGHVRCENPSATPLKTATYPRVLRTQEGLNDLNSAWFYPHGFSPANMVLHQDNVLLEGEGAWQALKEGMEASVSFTTHVPERAGTLGYLENTLYLLGGWHPVFTNSDALPMHRIHYRIHLPENTVGFVGNTPFGRNSPRTVEGVYYGTQLPVLVTAQATVHVSSPWVLIAPHNSYIPTQKSMQEVQRALQEGEEELSHFKTLTPTRPLIAVFVPLREQLVERFSGGLAISNRAFSLFPWKKFTLFHSMALWRHQFAARILPWAYTHETPYHADLVADTLACALREKHVEKTSDKRESAHALLNRIAVIPEIDALMFAPQTAFADTYHNTAYTPPTQRWRLDNFHHSLPEGVLLYQKIRDAQGVEKTWQQTHQYLTTPQRFEPLASHAYDAWLGPYPKVDYSVQQPTPSQVLVAAQGEDASRIHEPIQVAIQDAHKHKHLYTTYAHETLTPEVPLPLRSIEIDPALRLHETSTHPYEHPSFNNRTPKRWRLLLTNLSSLLGITAKQIAFNADVILRQIYDTRWFYSSKLAYTPRNISVYAGVHRGFGKTITPLARAHYASLTWGYDYLRSNAVLGASGQQVSLNMAYTYDTRLRAVSSFRGEGFSARAHLAHAWKNTSETYTYGTLGASALKLWPLGTQQALLARVGVDGVAGHAPSQYGVRLGGRYRGLRGYEEDEAWGTMRVTASLEWRHTLASLHNHSFWGLFTLTDLEGALFADAAYFKSNVCTGENFYDVGYGLRWIGEVFNISPMVLAVDVGVPFSRCTAHTRKQPFTVFMAFNQSFDPF